MSSNDPLVFDINKEETVRFQLLKWLRLERQEYAFGKWHEGNTENRERLLRAMAEQGLSEDGDWWGFVTQYLRRAQLQGLDTLQGRQQMGKAIVTMLGCLEAAMIVYGPMPNPGVPSGTIETWE